MSKEGENSTRHFCASVVNKTNALLAYWDTNLVCRFANDAYKEWFGVAPSDMIDKMTIDQLLGPLYKINLPYIHGALQGTTQVFERDIALPAGEIRCTLATYTPHIENGLTMGFYVHVADITDVKNGYHKNTLRTTVSGGGVSKLRGNVLENVVQTLQASLLTDFPGIAKLASMHFISESKLKRDFKLVYKTSIFSFFRNLQMEWAYDYFQQKVYNKTELAAMLKFANPSNFSACFNRYKKERESKITIAHLLRSNDERYKTFIAQSPFAIAMLDNDLNYLAVSKKYVDDHNLYNTSLTGIDKFSLFGFDNEKWQPIFAACLKGKILNGEEEIFEKAPSPRWIRWDIRPWYKNDDMIGGILIFTEDITAVRKHDAENKKIFEILEKANEIARIGTWKRNFVTNTGLWSRVTREILEVPDDFSADFETVLQFYKAGKSRNLALKAVQAALEKGEPFDIEVEMTTAKGNTKFVRVIGYPEFRSGKCERLFGIFQEIHKQPAGESTVA